MAAEPRQILTTIGTPTALQSHSPMLNERGHDREGGAMSRTRRLCIDLPDSVTTAAISLAVHTTGAVTFKTIVLITPEEVDAAVRKSVSYRPLDSNITLT
jgi:hypothetical protein